jgi:hypothetical protein
VFEGGTLSALKGKLYGVNSKFDILQTGSSSELYCINCEVKTWFKASGKLLLLGGKMKKNAKVMNADEVTISGVQFVFEGNYSLLIDDVKNADISSSKFVSSSTGAFNLQETAGANTVLMIANNDYYSFHGQGLVLDKIFQHDQNVAMAKLEKPSFTCASYDDTSFLVKINTEFTDTKWGSNNVVCPSMAQGGDHVNFELYLLRHEKNELVAVLSSGFFGGKEEIKTIEDVKYLHIPRDTKADGNSIENQKVAILVHCEGTGTTVFSESVEFKVCKDNQLMGENCTCKCTLDEECEGEKNLCQDGTCHVVQCVKDEDCGAGEKCQNDACVAPDEGCTSDSDCAAPKVCLDGTCISDITSGCQNDSDCDGLNNYCDAASKECKSCSEGEVFFSQTRTCILKKDVVPPPKGKGGGGCSLLR